MNTHPHTQSLQNVPSRNVLKGLCVCMMSICLSSCIFEYPPDDCLPPDNKVRVAFDWSGAPGAAPEGMSVLFYPADGSPYWQYETATAGGEVSLPANRYNVISYNNDISSILFENQDNYQEAMVTTRVAHLTDGLSEDWSYSQPPRSGVSAAEPVMAQPDGIWVASEEDFSNLAGNNEILTLRPRPFVAAYHVIVKDISNIESAFQAGMSVSGLVSGKYLCSGNPVEGSVTVPGELTRYSESGMQGIMKCFGRGSTAQTSELDIYFKLRDGTNKMFVFDITDIVDRAPDPMNVTIEVSGIALPKIETSSGSGLDVDLDEWDVVEIELST